MVKRVVPPRPQRVAILSAVFALHAMFLALLLRQREHALPAKALTSIALVTIDAKQPAAAKPPPPTPPAKIAKTFKPILEISIPNEVEPDSQALAGASSACPTMGAVTDGLLLDPTILTALQGAPPETRSIAGAIMMWNEGWIPAALVPEAPLWNVRANVEASLTRVSDACLDEEIIGPRLLPIPEAGGTSTLFVVLGSGRWKWRDMISPPPASPIEIVATPAPVVQR